MTRTLRDLSSLFAVASFGVAVVLAWYGVMG